MYTSNSFNEQKKTSKLVKNILNKAKDPKGLMGSSDIHHVPYFPYAIAVET